MDELTDTSKPFWGRIFDHKVFRMCWIGLKRISYRIFRLSGEVFGVAMTLGIAWLYGASWLLTQQSLNLNTVKPWVSQSFSKVFEGHEAEIDNLTAYWLPSEDRISLDVTNIVVMDKQGDILQAFPSLQTKFSLEDALKLRPVSTDVKIVGGTMTALVDENENITIGLGNPDTVGRFGPVYRGKVDGNNPGKLPEKFQSLTVVDGRVFVDNQHNSLSMTADIENLTLSKSPESLKASLKAYVEQSNGKALLNLNGETSRDRQGLKIEFQGEGLRLDELGPQKGRYRDLRKLSAPVDIVLDADLKRGEALRSVFIDLVIGPGEVTGFQVKLPLEEFIFQGTLNPGEEELTVKSVALKSDRLSFDGKGKLTELGKLNDGDINSSPLFDIVLNKTRVDATPIFEKPFNWTDVQMLGRLDFDAISLDLERLSITDDDYSASMATSVLLKNGRPHEFKAKGDIVGRFDSQDFVAIWPVNFADGARNWMDRSVIGGTISPLEFDINLDPEFFLNPALTPERYQLKFGLVKNDVRYIPTMSPLLGVSGVGRIDGNSLTVNYQGGQVGGATIESGVIRIPRLMPKGGDIIIEGRGHGKASDLMALLNQEPFQFADRYGVDPKKVGGYGHVEGKITRPLLVYFDQDRIEYEVQADFSDAVAPFQIGTHKIHNGRVKLTGDKTGVHITGPANIGPWPAEIEWHEYLGEDKRPTKYKVSGKMSRNILDDFGLGLREFFDGDISITAEAYGPEVAKIEKQVQMLEIETGKISIDFSDTEIAIGNIWSKVMGDGGILEADIARRDNGQFDLTNLEMNAPGLKVSGNVSVAENFRLIDFNMPSVEIEGLLDAAIQLKPDSDSQKLSLFIEGDYLDISPWTNAALNTRSAGLDTPILMTASLNTLFLKPDYAVNEARMLFAHTGQSVSNFRLAGQTEAGALKAEITSDPASGGRQLKLSIPDASKAAKTFLGFESTRGGRLEMNAKLPAIDDTGPIIGQAVMTDFKLQKTPFLAQILSLASLTGMSDMLGGEGLRFVRMDVPFIFTSDEIKVRDARLVGPVLGMSGDGDIKLTEKYLDFDGALVPVYTANNLLGDIPILGDIIVGEKGSGMFALTYSVKGPFDKTQISVNPLSALTPGFLKGIFKSKKEKLPDEIMAEIEAVKPRPEEE